MNCRGSSLLPVGSVGRRPIHRLRRFSQISDGTQKSGVSRLDFWKSVGINGAENLWTNNAAFSPMPRGIPPF
jgi:hypothetical protein